ncbi:hypothetical protein NESM_000501700 [Novymonas esmeraldas]|uniref:SHOCT domain-containing protein n=1 Tax=Novymonas esmeraldas TaxID=1808958 RepID=A0AAW0EPR6_9TRYP
MQRVCGSALRCVRVGGVAQSTASLPHTCLPWTASRRASSSSVPPSGGSAAVQSSSATPAAGTAHATPELDAEAAEQVRLAKELGEQAFGENTAILKKVALRGLRAFMVCAVGMAAFMWAAKRKKRELAASPAPAAQASAATAAAEEEDPTQRYLEEMRGLGFDVDTLEEELENERQAKAAASQRETG